MEKQTDFEKRKWGFSSGLNKSDPEIRTILKDQPAMQIQETTDNNSGKVNVIPLRAADISKKQENPAKKRFMLLLVFALSGIFGLIIFRSAGEKSDQIKNEANSTDNGANEISETIKWQTPDPVKADIRDITKSSAGGEDFNRLAVRGIIISSQGRTAIVGNEIVRIGDKVMGAEVIGIDKNSVVFSRNGSEWTQYIE